MKSIILLGIMTILLLGLNDITKAINNIPIREGKIFQEGFEQGQATICETYKLNCK